MSSVNKQTGAHFCPACGPVPAWATSNYCSDHTAQLWTHYLVLRASRRATPGNVRP
jgi:hypothetical protein